jgi:serine/threonine protein phosphatase PrpC
MIQFNTQKPNEASTANEDRWRVSPPLYAISDGAGGEGLAADKWAQTILDHLPDKSFDTLDEINDWIGTFCDSFENSIQEQIQSNPTAIERFMLQGSLATLVATWVHEEHFQYVSIGDSMLMLYNTEEKTLWTPQEDNAMQCFNDNPHLISLRDLTPISQIKLDKKSYKTNDILILATDAIAKLLIVLYQYSNDKNEYLAQKETLNNPNYLDYLTRLEQYCEKNPTFTFESLLQNMQNPDEIALHSYIISLYNDEILSYDDYTFLINIL